MSYTEKKRREVGGCYRSCTSLCVRDRREHIVIHSSVHRIQFFVEFYTIYLARHNGGRMYVYTK